MRALIQGLAAVASPFLADAFMLAIRGYQSEKYGCPLTLEHRILIVCCSWSIRNSSTMMYSVILDKMVGGRRGSSEQAATTCEQFFARFPTVYPFLLQELAASTAAQVVEAGGKKVKRLVVHPPPSHSRPQILYSSLYPVLVLFSRFLPAPEWRTVRGQALPNGTPFFSAFSQ